ncbi:MAG: hypothetical protein GY928_32435 [Colwellia sp.]|nr:hypothetical protein [Colwellia sp.]
MLDSKNCAIFLQSSFLPDNNISNDIREEIGKEDLNNAVFLAATKGC